MERGREREEEGENERGGEHEPEAGRVVCHATCGVIHQDQQTEPVSCTVRHAPRRAKGHHPDHITRPRITSHSIPSRPVTLHYRRLNQTRWPRAVQDSIRIDHITFNHRVSLHYAMSRGWRPYRNATVCTGGPRRLAVRRTPRLLPWRLLPWRLLPWRPSRRSRKAR